MKERVKTATDMPTPIVNALNSAGFSNIVFILGLSFDVLIRQT